MTTFYQAACVVSEDGYRWMDAKPEKGRPGRYLIAVGGERRVYNPLQEARALFQHFANIEPTEEHVATFAGKYGCLGKGANKFVVVDGAVLPGESLAGWREEIESMRIALALWAAVKDNDRRQLARWIKWAGTRHVGLTMKLSGLQHSSVIADAEKDTHPDRLKRFKTGDMIEPALTYAQQLANEGLRGSNRLHCDQEPRVSPQVLLDKCARGTFLVPAGLIGVLWLQFADALTGMAEYVRCAVCGHWFNRSICRADRSTCSKACKQRAYRERKAEGKS